MICMASAATQIAKTLTSDNATLREEGALYMGVAGTRNLQRQRDLHVCRQTPVISTTMSFSASFLSLRPKQRRFRLTVQSNWTRRPRFFERNEFSNRSSFSCRLETRKKRNNRSAFSTITVWEKFWLGFSKNWSPYTGGGTDIVQERGGSDFRWIAAVASNEAVKKTLQSFDLLNSKRAHSLCLGRYYEKRESSIGFNKRSFGWNRIKGNRFAS